MQGRLIGFQCQSSWVNLDEQRFQQVMLNYQSNALKFTNSGGKLLLLLQYIPGREQNGFLEGFRQRSKDKVTEEGMADLSSDEDDGYYDQAEKDKLVLTVQDSGVGISKQDQAQLFQLFGCLSSTRQRNS